MTGAEWFLVFVLHNEPYALGPFWSEVTCRAAIEAATAEREARWGINGSGGSSDWNLPASATCEQRETVARVPPALNIERPNPGVSP